MKTTTPSKAIDNFPTFARAFLCVFMSVVLVAGFTPLAPKAYAADANKPESVTLKVGSSTDLIDVTKNVATLDSQKGSTELVFTVKDAYSGNNNVQKERKLMVVDSSGKETASTTSKTDEIRWTVDKLSADKKLVLVTSATSNAHSALSKRYEQQLNVRVANTKAAETNNTANASNNALGGISKDGGTWSFSNGLQYTFKNTGFKFLDNTTMNLGALRLPLQYKHNTDGTTIVGINCSPEDVAFYNAVKNGNVWQKYTTEKMAAMTSKMDKGWSGKEFGKWGGKGFDWNVCGFMEYNTQKPDAPRAVNLIISMGMKADGHAQYLCFTGTITFTIGGKATLTGKLTPAKGVEGKFGMGAYAGLELYIGLGLNYVASVGGYGKGQISIDFDMLPDFALQKILLSGELGAKAKLFGFTIYTWTILKGEKPLYKRDNKGSSLAKTASDGPLPNGAAAVLNADGTATSPFTVGADTAYPLESRNYLNTQSAVAAGQSSALSTQDSKASTTILKGIYGEAEPAVATTNNGPVVVYVADAQQIDGGPARDVANRSVLAYTRLVDGTWTTPKIIDTSTLKYRQFADYNPAISTDGENCYVTWLAADSKISEGDTIGQVGAKLDVNMATITKDDKVTVETVSEESNENGTMPASPKAVKTADGLFVGWYTNQTSGNKGEVIGLNGPHTVRLYKRGDTGWAESSKATTESGAITSFDVGSYGGTAACAWSFDPKFASEPTEVDLNGKATLVNSEVSALTAGNKEARMLAHNSTNAQFAKQDGADVLTYAVQIDPNDGSSNPYLSIVSSSDSNVSGSTVLDGAKVNLPTPYYKLAGDLNKNGNVSFLVSGDGSTDIQALVTKGAGSSDWTSIVDATITKDVVTNYCATYYPNGLPLFIYMTEPVSASSGLSTQADDSGADMNQSTEDSLKHFSILDADYDEYEVKAGQKMPITVYFENDGLLNVDGCDLWMLEDGAAKKVATSDSKVALDEDGEISFEYAIPAKETFTKAKEFTLYVAPKGVAVTADMIEHAKTIGSTYTVTIGAASLSLAADQQIVDGQESIAATVTNDGIVPHGAKLVYLNADTNETLASVDVPELQEGEAFSNTYSAPKGYFQNDGIANIIVTLEDDGTESEGYNINNTEFISTWQLLPNKTAQAATPATNTSSKATAKATTPSTGDPVPIGIFVVLVLAGGSALVLLVRSRKNCMQR